MQIPAFKVDFWRLHDQGMDLESMTCNEMYPPRFKLVVYGKNSTEPAIAKVTFTGSQDDLDTDILLEPADIGMEPYIGMEIAYVVAVSMLSVIVYHFYSDLKYSLVLAACSAIINCCCHFPSKETSLK